MICAACGEPTALEPCEECGKSPLLDGRYRLEVALGIGASGTTWRGSTLVDGKALATVAIKELRIANLDSAKARELVEREIRVLREVEHPAIPRYWEDLFVGKGRGKCVYIVQDFVDGVTLAEESKTRRYTEDEVLDITAEILRILRYLHGLRPPIVHRDIKPANVIRRLDGRLALIDFGAVRDCVKGDVGGSTVAGTFGYMAPEQFRGDAWPVTDLYGVGALAVALLSRKEPQQLLDWSGHLKWEGPTAASPDLAAFLRRLLAPDPMARFPSVDDALGELGRVRRSGRSMSTSFQPLRPATAPRELRVALERIAGSQPGMTKDAVDDAPDLTLPEPLVKWTSQVPRRPELVVDAPIYVTDTPPSPWPGRLARLLGSLLGALGMTFAAISVLWGVIGLVIALQSAQMAAAPPIATMRAPHPPALEVIEPDSE